MESTSSSFFTRLSNLDRRIIYLLILSSIVISLIFKLQFKEFPSAMTKKVFDKIESLPENSKVLVAMDYDPASEPELQPMAVGFVRQLASRKAKLYFVALYPMGPIMTSKVVDGVLKKSFPDYTYGTDYVELGYKSGNQGVINVMLTNIKKLFTTDRSGTDINTIPLMEHVTNLSDFDLIISVSAGYPGIIEWIQFGSDPAGVPIINGSTAVQAPQIFPYFPRQLVGVLGGIKAAAEYETMVKENYPAIASEGNLAIIRMGPQTIAHLIIIFFIVVGNICFFMAKRKRKY